MFQSKIVFSRASAHLGYIGLGITAGLLVGSPRNGLILLAVLGALLLLGYAFSRSSEFLRQHEKQAARYHRLGLGMAMTATVVLIWVTIFTWGLGLPLAFLLVPAAAYWMAPTLLGASRALRGKSHQYTDLSWYRASKRQKAAELETRRASAL